jgi:hypothetical protein
VEAEKRGAEVDDDKKLTRWRAKNSTLKNKN